MPMSKVVKDKTTMLYKITLPASARLGQDKASRPKTSMQA